MSPNPKNMYIFLYMGKDIYIQNCEFLQKRRISKVFLNGCPSLQNISIKSSYICCIKMSFLFVSGTDKFMIINRCVNVL
jgi:hypothetical protein